MIYSCAGLNQNIQSTHKHLQTMLQHKKIPQPLTLLSLYSSGVLNLSKYSLETFFTLCTIVTIPETFKKNTELNIRLYMIKNIMETVTTHESNLLSTTVREKILVGLVMKLWPYKHNSLPISEATDKRQYETIEDCFKITAFDKGLLFNQTIKVHGPAEKVNILVYSDEIFQQLLQQLQSLILNVLSQSDPVSCSQIIKMINTIAFILRVYSELIIEGLLPAESINTNQNFRNLLSKLCVTLQTSKHLEDLLVLEEFESFLKLKLHSVVTLMVRNEISVKLLKVCFDFGNFDQVDGSGKFNTK